MTPRLVHAVDGCEIWLGDSLDPETSAVVMQGRQADLLHCDAPYSSKTHEGHRAGKITADRAASFGAANPNSAIGRYGTRSGTSDARADIEYSAWDEHDITLFGEAWLHHFTGWATTITDHVLAPYWTTLFERSTRYVFPPLPWVELGSRVRMAGDGPSCWSCQVVVARPHHEPYSKWGTLRGAYVGPAENHQNRPDRITGGKSLALTIELLADYSRRGQLVLDPCLGGGTTMLAARMSGRRCIGIERDEKRAELCARLITSKREQRSLFETEATS